MIDIVLKVLFIKIKLTRPLKTTIADLTTNQYLAFLNYIHGNISDRKLIAVIYDLNPMLAAIITRRKFWRYQLITLMETFTDIQVPVNKIMIRQIPNINIICQHDKLKGISFMQFMFIDTMFSQYIQSRSEDHLLPFIASLYMMQDEEFETLNMEDRIKVLSKTKIDPILYEGILLNYMMLKKWLSNAYPFMFSSSEATGTSEPKKQQRWLDIFDSFVVSLSF